MPELPEVQTMVNDLNAAGVSGVVIEDVQVFWNRTIANCRARDFCHKISGREIKRLYRRAKYLVFELNDGLSLIAHLRMTGRFVMGGNLPKPRRHVQVAFALDNQQYLMFHDTRKFGRFYLTRSPEKILGSLGPEPLDSRFSAKVLAHRVRNRHRRIKTLLLDQGFLAGMGNIYTDEALWRASIHPLRLADSLAPDEICALHRAIRFVLRQGVQNGGTSLGKGEGNFQSVRSGQGRNAAHLKVYRRTELPCPRCRKPIEKIIVGHRSTHLCRVCQRIG